MNPKDSKILIGKVDVIAEKVTRIDDKIPELITQVNGNTKSISSFRKLFWIFIAAICTVACGTLLAMII